MQAQYLGIVIPLDVWIQELQKSWHCATKRYILAFATCLFYGLFDGCLPTSVPPPSLHLHSHTDINADSFPTPCPVP